MKKIVLMSIVFSLFNTSLLFAQWESDIRLTIDDSSSYFSCVAAGSDSLVHVIWMDDRDGNAEIYYKRSDDLGITWSTDTRLTSDTAISNEPFVCSSDSLVHVVWQDFRHGNVEVFYKRSLDGGVTWEQDVRLTDNSARSLRPKITAAGSMVHVVWCDERDGNFEIYHKRSTDKGATWEQDTRLTDDPGYSGGSMIAVANSIVHVVWADNRFGNWDIFYKRSTDSGLNWEQDRYLTNDPTHAFSPCVSVSGSSVHVVWSDSRDGGGSGVTDIYYRRSDDEGVNWGNEERITFDMNDSNIPSVYASNLLVHVIWWDDRDHGMPSGEVYYKRSTDSGISWSNDTRLTTSVGYTNGPRFSVFGPTIHVVWNDGRDGNWEVYYKRNPTGNTSVKEEQFREIEKKKHFLRPSIFKDRIVLELSGMLPGFLKILICNVYGATVFEKDLACNSRTITIEDKALKRLAPGVYFLTVVSGERTLVTEKLVKQ